MKFYKNKVVVIIGVVLGIGCVLVVDFVKWKCNLVLSDVDEKGLVEMVQMVFVVGVRVIS